MASQFATTLPNRRQQLVALGLLTFEQGDLLGVFAHAHQIEAEICFVALLLEIESRKRPADQMGENGADDGVNERRPEQIARDCPCASEQVQRRGPGQIPEDHGKRASVTTEFSRPRPIGRMPIPVGPESINCLTSSAMR